MQEFHVAPIRIAVTGAHGFVGRELSAVLQKNSSGCLSWWEWSDTLPTELWSEQMLSKGG